MIVRSPLPAVISTSGRSQQREFKAVTVNTVQASVMDCCVLWQLVFNAKQQFGEHQTFEDQEQRSSAKAPKQRRNI